MPETPTEALTFPCLEDPEQRHWIQDLAEDADRALVRIRSDIEFVTKRPKAEIRRPTGTTQSLNNGTTTLTYTTVDYDNTVPPWANAAAGTLTPHLPGMYYVDLSTRIASSTLNLPDSAVIDVQYNGVTVMARKFNQNQGSLPMKIAGLIPISATSALPTLISRVTLAGAPGPVLFERSRLALQYWARCGAPLNSNPWFEELGVTGWTGINAALSLYTADKYRGNSSMRIVGAAVGASARAAAVPVTVGRAYLMGYWGKSLGANFNYAPAIRWLDAGMVLLSTSTGTTVVNVNTEWRRANMRAVAPALAAFAEPVIVHTGVSAATDIIVDDTVFSAACG